MIRRLLVANRGEIARRLIRGAHAAGCAAVAVYAADDASSPHVGEADAAVLLPGASLAETYLSTAALVGAAVATGADALHPGYGFLSENPDLAEACTAAGVVWVGPSPDAMRVMGHKARAKELVAAAGVPILPGVVVARGADQAALGAAAASVGYPLLVKASAGGGGRGMRVVHQASGLADGVAAAQREAAAAFGSDEVFLERYLESPRHVEVQVIGDAHGTVLHLLDRECSVQRRHQKVVEEAPASQVPDAIRHRMWDAAVAAARAVDYVGVGTVEYLVDASGFYFLEMNTRLQVEHPVTEMITGLDLVEWQLRVAAGQALPLRQDQLALDGHAIEARIYAENPEKGFLPAIGSLQYLHTPPAVQFCVSASGQHKAQVRIDSGVRQGDAISPFYDPMIAKLIVWGPDRLAALANMAAALAQYRIVGLASNISFLQRLTSSSAFTDADLDTGLIARHHDSLFPAPQAPDIETLALAAAALLAQETSTERDPWAQSNGWRLNSNLMRNLRFADDAGSYDIAITYHGTGRWQLHSPPAQAGLELHLQQRDGAALLVTLDGNNLHGHVVRSEDDFHIFHGANHRVLRWDDPLAHAGQQEHAGGRLTAPMPGKIVAVLVEPGQEVAQGAPLLIMEAMKMEHTITAPAAGTVDTVLYQVGDQVAEGTQLLSFVL